MLEERNADLVAQKRKKLLERLITKVGRSGYDLYYAPTSAVATHLMNYVKMGANLNADELALLDGLDRRDIEVLLSIKD